MEEKFKFTTEELAELQRIAAHLKTTVGDTLEPDDENYLRQQLEKEISDNKIKRDVFGLNPILLSFQTAELELAEIGMKRECVLAILLYNSIINGILTPEEVERKFGHSVAQIIHGLVRIHELYQRTPIIENENFRNLLLSFAEDMRVILIMITDRVNLMRQIRDTSNKEAQSRVAEEASYLYAPLAHKLGLYKLKSELEDLSLKYLEHDAYYMIKDKLNATKRSRDAYIEKFIQPIDDKLKQMGIKCHIKGRTKSIHSIWQKMKKQQCGFEGIYDLFAIRIIIDSPIDQEKMLCWQTYSLITDMYQPNPKRLRDWLSVPKSNGYESLHITVLGPENKWVEVQIRTERMDEIAERGLAAHWRYKGIKSEGNLDAWMKNVRDILETAENGPSELMKNMTMDVYNKEVFVFTPKGDLYRLPLGASLLDFAFHIHTRLGCQCIGGRVNGCNRKINYKLQSGDTVEVFTSPQQQPKRDWLSFAVTSKARNKIRVTLKEQQNRAAELGRELLQRRFKNRKIEIEENILTRLIRKLGFKTTTDFYSSLGEERTDINDIFEQYEVMRDKTSETAIPTVSAEEFVLRENDDNTTNASDVLVIGHGKGVKGLNYKMARCCNPIYGDEVFGFISAEGYIKIHRSDCPNAANIRQKYPYRIIRTRWSGHFDGQMSATLRILGQDDIGIITNITSIITKEHNTSLRNIAVDSNDGLFQGYVVVGVGDTAALNNLIKKIKTVKGVKDVQRSK